MLALHVLVPIGYLIIKKKKKNHKSYGTEFNLGGFLAPRGVQNTASFTW